MSKRRKFLLVAVLLTVGLWVTQWVDVEWRYQALAGLGGLALLLSGWAMWEDLQEWEWLTILTLPMLYPVSVGMFYFLLPEKFLSKVIILGLFGVGMYALLLTENIFSVAAIRTIQLLRAAHAVGFLLTLASAFFWYDTIWSFRLPFWANGLLVAGVSWPLLLQGLWSVELTEGKISGRVLLYASVVAVSLGQAAMGLSFWPVTISVGSLFLVSMFYVALGICQQYFLGRLFRRTLSEYLTVGIVVLTTIILVTRWE